MRIAVVGAGISGLVAAYLLSEDHDVTVFEGGDHAGGHTLTVPVRENGRTIDVDMGFIVFNDRNYPGFVKLIDRLDVAWQPTRMSFSVRCDRTGVEYGGSSLRRLFAQRRNLARPRFHRMLRDIFRFYKEAPSLLASETDDTSVGDFLAARRFGREFAEHYLIPLGASLWSSPAEGFLGFPIRFVVEFLRNHGMLGERQGPRWRVVRGGSRRYVEKLTDRFRHRIRLGTPVRRITRLPDAVTLATDASTERFDHAVVACHADQALALLTDPTPVERELLGAFPYQANSAVLHTDTSVLPRRRILWSSWNYHVPAERRARVAVTYDMNVLQSLSSAETYCVTLNDDAGIDPGRVLRRVTFDHPTFGAGRIRAQRRHGELVRANHTSYCGAYWGYGFHEDGVQSALAVAAAFGKSL